jgi:hypothetical protein
MRDIRQYWREVRALEARLPEHVWLVSGNAVAQVTAAAAAPLIHAETHRIATDEEIAAHHSAESETKQRMRLDRLRREGRALVVPPHTLTR